MKKIVLASIVTFGLAIPAYAGQCPAIMAKIDAAMQTTSADDATRAKVTELYNKGKAEHESGDHAASVATLNEALALLGQ
jgi:hypothetical protein